MYYAYTQNPWVDLVVAYIFNWFLLFFFPTLGYIHAKGVIRSICLGLLVCLSSFLIFQVNAFLFFQMDMPMVALLFVSLLQSGIPAYAGFIAILWDIYTRFTVSVEKFD